jgi:hypothetical protein
MAMKRFNPYLMVLIWSISLFLPLLIITGLEGTLFTSIAAQNITRVLQSHGLDRLIPSVEFMARKAVGLSFLSDISVIIILVSLFPGFVAVSLNFYEGFGVMVWELYTRGLHVALKDRDTYHRIVREYNESFASSWMNVSAWVIGLGTAVLLNWARSTRSWWGHISNPYGCLSGFVIVAGVSYYLFGVGTFRGWISLKFCRQFFSGSQNVLKPLPWHPDGFNGLRCISRVLAAVYLGALLSGLCVFVSYRLSLFGETHWVLGGLVILGIIDYSVFVTVPTILIFRRCSESRGAKLEQLGAGIRGLAARLECTEASEDAGSDTVQTAVAMRLNGMIKIYDAYRGMSVVPLSLRQVAIGSVFYCAQVAQIVAVILYILLKR